MGAGRIIKRFDHALTQAYLKWVGERGALLCFLFHGLFEDEKELKRGDLAPIQNMTKGIFRRFIAYYLEHGYTFVSHREILGGLEPGRKYALITFDDGYYNNLRALPVMREFKTPALFFISTNHIKQGKCFWWDAFYREGRKRGWSDDRIDAESGKLKDRTHDSLEEELIRTFGPDCLRPRGDLDRPFTPAELAEFARDPLVHLGNHTADHAILTNYSREEMRRQIAAAQEDLREMTGSSPEAIAYPNGNYNRDAMEVSREGGLRIGFSCERRKARPRALRRGDMDLMHVGRFLPQGGGDLEFQFANYRSDISPYAFFKAMSSGSY